MIKIPVMKKKINIIQGAFIVISTTLLFFFIGLFIFENNNLHYKSNLSTLAKLNISLDDTIFNIVEKEKSLRLSTSYRDKFYNIIVLQKDKLNYENFCNLKKIEVSNDKSLIQIFFGNTVYKQKIEECNEILQKKVQDIYTEEVYKLIFDKLLDFKYNFSLLTDKVASKPCFGDTKIKQLYIEEVNKFFKILDNFQEIKRNKNPDKFLLDPLFDLSQNLKNSLVLSNFIYSSNQNFNNEKVLDRCEVFKEEILYEVNYFDKLRYNVIKNYLSGRPDFSTEYYLDNQDKKHISGLKIKFLFSLFGFLLSLIVIKFYPFKINSKQLNEKFK